MAMELDDLRAKNNAGMMNINFDTEHLENNNHTCMIHNYVYIIVFKF